VAAFRATLEEVVEADLILHVRDISHPETEAQRHDVNGVLADLGIAADGAADRPLLEVWNKIDRLSRERREELTYAAGRNPEGAVLVSAATGDGMDRLRRVIDAQLGAEDVVVTVEVPPNQGRLLSWLHANGDVLDEETAETGAVTARVRIDPAVKGKLDRELKRAGIAAN
jgi:GTP-binding protein HflX